MLITCDVIYSCRPINWPFYFGFAASYIVLVLFTSLMYGVGFYLMVHNSQARKKYFYPVVIMGTLFILFIVAWIFGLIGSNDGVERNRYIAAQYIFSILVLVHSILTVFLYILWSTDSRNKWYGLITCNKHGKKAYSTTGENIPSSRDTELSTQYTHHASPAREDAPLTPTEKSPIENIYTQSPGASDNMQAMEEQIKVNLGVDDDDDDDDRVVTSL